MAKDPATFNTGITAGGAITCTDLTATGSFTWGDAISDVLTVSGLLKMGTSASPLVLTAGTPIFTLYTTNAGTSGSTNAEPFLVKSTLTGAGQVGGRSKFHTYSNVASGGWVNALKAYMEFGASGRTTGLASALCAELVLSAGTSSGAYAALEGELVLGSGASTGGQTSFIYLNTSGTGAATFDTNGYLFHIGDGITAASGKFCGAYYQSLKCFFTDSSTTRYMVLSQTEDGVGLGTSGSPMAVTYNGTKPFSLYTTSASTNASTSLEPFYVSNTLTGAGQVGGRALFYMTANVALGGWSNALKANVVYGASGRTAGMGSAFCAEMTLSAGTTAGHYAPLESEIVLGSGASTGNATAFLYMNATGDGVATFDTNGYLFEVGTGITAGSGKMFATTDVDAISITHSFRILVDGTAYYIPCSTSAAYDA